jgi:hypothetical protein
MLWASVSRRLARMAAKKRSVKAKKKSVKKVTSARVATPKLADRISPQADQPGVTHVTPKITIPKSERREVTIDDETRERLNQWLAARKRTQPKRKK